MKYTLLSISAVLTSTLLVSPAVHAQTLVAQYLFGGNLASSVSGAPNLVSVDPESDNGFVTATVDGSSRTVFQWQGLATPPTDQAGLSLNTTGLIPASSYSVDMVFSLANLDGWRRLIDVQDRTSDDGFYVNPSQQLDVYPSGSGGATLAANTYENVALTVSGTTVTAYLNGSVAFTATTGVMAIANAGNLMDFFLDNTAGGGQGEYSNGEIALLDIYNGVLSADQVSALNNSPLPGQGQSVPDLPGTAGLTTIAVAGLAALKRSLNRTSR
jgi:hypothetical protein